METETCSKHFSFSSSWEYDVFLNFREEDTGKSFTDHLNKALNQKGIFTFKDDEKLGSKAALDAIEASRFAIAVFSSSYASSPRCLDQLVKIVECKKEQGLTVFPVCYHVDCANLFGQLENVSNCINIQKVERWKGALSEVVSLSGWNLNDRYESDFIQEFVKYISEQLCPMIPSANNDILVGMASHMKNMDLLLGLGFEDVRTVGIWGIGGIGKTTLALQVFNRIKDKFEACAFINVKEEYLGNGIIHLQKQLHQILWNIEGDIWKDYAMTNLLRNKMRSKRVLIILDDVDKVCQIEALVGSSKEQHLWLGQGSRVIVTTTNKHLLKSYGEEYIYKVDKLAKDEVLQLFQHEAVKNNRNLDDFEKLKDKVIEYADGHPLALKGLVSFLVRENVYEWSEALAKLNEIPIDEDIFYTFKASFDGLDAEDRNIFLDIACFFDGKDRHDVEKILASKRFHPKIGIQVLVEKSLLNVQENKLRMPKLLQEFGRKIVARRAKQTI